MNIINTCTLTYIHTYIRTCTHTALLYDCSDDSDGGSTDDNDDDDSSDDSDADDGDGSDDSLEGAAPTPKRRKQACTRGGTQSIPKLWPLSNFSRCRRSY